MVSRLMAAAALAALCALPLGPASASTIPLPMPTATPRLKTIKHVYATRMCTGLRRSIAPAVGRVLENDRTIAVSRPMFQDYVKNTSSGSQGAVDMDVMHLERLITPLVNNTQDIDRLLNDPIYPRKAQSETDKELLQMRAHLAAVLEEQKRALDLISGFVDTEQLGELQASGHEYDKAINSTGTTQNVQAPSTSPTTAPAPILNAGVTNANNDPSRKYDPRFLNTGSQVGYNPLNAFDQQMSDYQTTIAGIEDLASKAILRAVPQCGGQVPGSPAPVPVPSPTSPTLVLPSSPSPEKP